MRCGNYEGAGQGIKEGGSSTCRRSGGKPYQALTMSGMGATLYRLDSFNLYRVLMNWGPDKDHPAVSVMMNRLVSRFYR